MNRTSLSSRLVASARDAWRLTAPTAVRRSAQPVIRRILERRVVAALRYSSADTAPGSLVVSGLFSEAKGVSQGARLSLAAFRAAGLAPIEHDLRHLFNRSGASERGLPTAQPGGVWFVHVNAPEAIHALGRLHPKSWQDRYRIAYWAYELPRVPQEWVRASQAFHEIWAPSEFVVAALRSSGVKIPVRLMPHPVALGAPPAKPDRPAFGIPSDAFVVLTLADLHSSAARKNLIGAIDIYKLAFPSADSARLIVKVREDAAHPVFLSQARQAAYGRPDISFMTGNLSSGEMRGLIASSSLVLSPHRAEGFGLSLAEAFLSGVPALATGWSGNADFLTDLPELSIRYSLVPVRDAYRVYRARGQLWAEPDVDDAVTKLRTLAGSPDLRTRAALKGRKAIEGMSLPWSREALLAMPLGRLATGGSDTPAVGPVAAIEPSR
jgi:glycosyltransferase involved in cell wall biosynthesis